ncbi:MAG: hypothetical protein J7647_13405 [Cyanobacteria bacterium SBLK]|nr:hypothetical protein [Cyanobacteria bacterium SBLK]
MSQRQEVAIAPRWERLNGKSYLDTRKAGCEGNALCVSAATSPNRAKVGTAKWKILSASGKKGAVQCNDIVYLQNQAKYQSKFTYLDTRSRGCEGDALCVSASFSPDRAKVGTGKWKLICTGGDIKKPVSLQNQAKFQGKFTYLDTNGAGCEGNAFCVSTSFSPDRAKVGTGKWSILPAK